MEKIGLRVTARKTKVMICGTGLAPCRVQANTHALSVVQEKAQTTASTAMAVFWCIRNTAGYND